MTSDKVLPLESVVTNSNGLTDVPAHQDNLVRDAGLTIRLPIGGQAFWLSALGPLFPPPEPWDAEIPVDPIVLFGHVEDCRQVWQSSVVDYEETVAAPGGGQQKRFPFQDKANLSAHRELLDRALPALAVAGRKLFYHLFEEHAGADLQRIVARLHAAAAERELVLTITSNRFFVPWNLLYTHPKGHGNLSADGSNARWEGFWGYRHIVEHNPQWVNLRSGITPAAGKILAGINIDERLDVDLGVKCIEPQLTFFSGLPFLGKIERRVRASLEADLSSAAFSDQIMYFCCHGTGGSADGGPNLRKAQVSLSDGKPIRGDDISYWLLNRDLASHPFVFVNACQGGQMTTMFYETLATELLRRNAVALVGTQIDIPAIFAAEYAIALFTRFFKTGAAAPVRLGPLLRSLSRDMIDSFANPLGLVYSLYRGMDCHVAWP